MKEFWILLVMRSYSKFNIKAGCLVERSTADNTHRSSHSQLKLNIRELTF